MLSLLMFSLSLSLSSSSLRSLRVWLPKCKMRNAQKVRACVGLDAVQADDLIDYCSYTACDGGDAAVRAATVGYVCP